MKRPFPKDIKHGNVHVRIYKKQNRGKPIFMIRYSLNGESKEFSRRNLRKVEDKALEIATNINNGRAKALTLTDDDRAEFLTAKFNLQATGKSLFAATAEYAQAWTALNGRPLIVAADYYAVEVPHSLRQISVVDALMEMLDQKRSENVSQATLRRLRTTVLALAKAVPGFVSEISEAALIKYLAQFTHPKTRNNYRGDINTFLRWCQSKLYLPAGKNIATHNIKCARIRRSTPGILAVAQMKSLLEAADYSMIPYIAICGFAGIRPEETKRLEWSDIYWEDSVIRVSELAAKTRDLRLVPITDNLIRWLRPFRHCQGVIAVWPDITAMMTALARELGFQWLQNSLRHSYASYRYPVLKSLDLLADEMGNSVDKLNKNYVARGLAASDVKAYWNIQPTSALARPLSPNLEKRFPRARARRTVQNRIELQQHAGNQLSETQIQRLTLEVGEELKDAPAPDLGHWCLN